MRSRSTQYLITQLRNSRSHCVQKVCGWKTHRRWKPWQKERSMLESQGRKVGLASRREGSAICCHWFSVDGREPQNEPGLILCCPSRKFQNPAPPLSSVGTPLSVEAKMGHCRACSHDLNQIKRAHFVSLEKQFLGRPLHGSISELEMVFKRFWHFPEAREGAHLPHRKLEDWQECNALLLAPSSVISTLPLLRSCKWRFCLRTES